MLVAPVILVVAVIIHSCSQGEMVEVVEGVEVATMKMKHDEAKDASADGFRLHQQPSSTLWYPPRWL